jgi:hypothetical protein
MSSPDTVLKGSSARSTAPVGDAHLEYPGSDPERDGRDSAVVLHGHPAKEYARSAAEPERDGRDPALVLTDISRDSFLELDRVGALGGERLLGLGVTSPFDL